jgi:hypothetical protein
MGMTFIISLTDLQLGCEQSVSFSEILNIFLGNSRDCSFMSGCIQLLIPVTLSPPPKTKETGRRGLTADNFSFDVQ